MLEFGEDLLDRIEVRAMGRQDDPVDPSGADGLASRFARVAGTIVEDDDLARCEGGCQTIDHARRADPIVTAPR
ncbi:hypothetical protein GCM10007857_81170 [Bradyrhizobium iriomotense]|uniref:Uncharacterized protein n=1 Tax=Bradyrhizobium iriomotense TaxID=441950 RepID=A0ABQ6BAM5_9BRAD|nr:hypothetical protein GCM10007857_81170 [Bradyrhizobium iriomotense]